MFALAGMEVPLCAGGEIRDPARTVPRALAGALAFVVTACTSPSTSIAQGVLGGGVLADSQAPLADALAKGGPGGRALLLAVRRHLDVRLSRPVTCWGPRAFCSPSAGMASSRAGWPPFTRAPARPMSRSLVHALAAAGLLP